MKSVCVFLANQASAISTVMSLLYETNDISTKGIKALSIAY
ncbi:hypothetical protein Cst_c19390 [Thermoclostridium stercorarium subsp. stercorarium DSM 8532]|uniref:Uncharacterized protein n=1 Tax=Thermoclostridium stercorarium (strain ATCC 35414 / DSM 8532 / NCIMB 11754) TaxID=1121335 RepID=L7VR81_THES1|nr:hypothetical protein Cst_c19390 [Thermoclostridium stercorarium subsp. stercorarium DSM 8532]